MLLPWLAVSFAPAAQDVQISDPEGIAPSGNSPSVAHNPIEDEHLVVWSGVQGIDADILGQRVDAATGAPIGPNFRVTDTQGSRENNPTVVYNSVHHEYLVVWEGEATPNEWDIFGQRLDAVSGDELGANDFQISTQAELHPFSPIRLPDVDYDEVRDQYLVVWTNDVPGEDEEVFGRFLDGATGGFLTPDFQISEPGSHPYDAAVAFGSAAGEALVLWRGSTGTHSEAFGRRVDAVGRVPLGSNVVVSSAEQQPGDVSVSGPDLAYDPTSGTYLVAWDDGEEEDGETGVWIQRVADTTGALLLPDDQRIGAHSNASFRVHVEHDAARQEFIVGWASSEQPGLPTTSGLVAVDLDGDGLDDAATAISANSTFAALHSVPGGGVHFPSPHPIGIAAGALAAAQLDGDGSADLVFASFGGQVSVLLSKGGGAFGAPTVIDVGSGTQGLVVADATGDGIPDIVTANSSSDDVTIVPGTGPGTFGTPTHHAGLADNHAVQVGDVDGDGTPDLVVATDFIDRVGVLRGLGGGAFDAPWVLATEGEPETLAVADFNADGRTDVAAAGDVGGPPVPVGGTAVFLGQPDGTLAVGALVPLGVDGTFDLAVADFDGDTHADFAVTRSGAQNFAVVLGNGDGTFAAPVDYEAGFLPHDIEAGNFDGQGGVDLCVRRGNDHTFAYWFGAGDGTFEDPAVFGPADREVFAQRLRSDGSEVGPDDRRISALGPAGHPEVFVGRPSVAVSANGVLYAFQGGDVGDDVFGYSPTSQVYVHGTAACSAAGASQTVRLGTPPNPAALSPTGAGPFPGTTWSPAIDHTSFASDSVQDVLLVGFSPTEIDLGLPGTLLCLPTAPAVLVPAIVPGGAIDVPIPDSCALAGLTFCAQGLATSLSQGPLLTNALDVVVGTE